MERLYLIYLPKLYSKYVAELDHLIYLNPKAYALNLYIYSTGPRLITHELGKQGIRQKGVADSMERNRVHSRCKLKKRKGRGGREEKKSSGLQIKHI